MPPDVTQSGPFLCQDCRRYQQSSAADMLHTQQQRAGLLSNPFQLQVDTQLAGDSSLLDGMHQYHQTVLNTKKVTELPIVSFDWNPEKLGLCVLASGI